MSQTNNRNPQSNRNVFPNQTNHLKHQKTYAEIWQDKGASQRDRIVSPQPAPREDIMRPQSSNKTLPRSHTKSIPKRKTTHLTLWVKPVIKEEVQRIAHREGLSVSAVGGAFLEQGFQQNIDLQYGALLKPVIEQAIAREMRTISSRLAWLLVRVAFDSGQIRSMVTNILGRQPGVTPGILQTILEGSGKTAKANITRCTPQLVELIEAIEKGLVAGEGERTNSD